METVRLSNGAELNGRVLDGGDGIYIYVYLMGVSMKRGFNLFSDSSKTERITFINYGNTHVFEGYTELYSISNEYGNCNIVMRKGAVNAT